MAANAEIIWPDPVIRGAPDSHENSNPPSQNNLYCFGSHHYRCLPHPSHWHGRTTGRSSASHWVVGVSLMRFYPGQDGECMEKVGAEAAAEADAAPPLDAFLFYIRDLAVCGHLQLGTRKCSTGIPMPCMGCSDHGTTLGHALLLAAQRGALGVSSVSFYDTNMTCSWKGRPEGLQGWPDMIYHATCTLSAPEQDMQQTQSFLALIFGHLSRE